MPGKTRNAAQGYAGVYFIEKPRPDGNGVEKIYYIRYRKDGKQIEEKVGGQFRDKMTPAKAARMRCQRIEGRQLTNAEKRAGNTQPGAAAGPSLNSLWSKFEKAKRANRSIKVDEGRYRNFIRPRIGAKTIPELVNEDFTALRQELEESGKAPQTVKHVLALIRRIINFAVANGYVQSIPASLRLPFPKVDNNRTENLTQEQARKLLQALDEEGDQTRASILRLALFTGMRRGAILHLRWQDVDFETGFITLAGKSAKNGRTERIPMNERARAELESIQRGASPYVFPGRDKIKPVRNIKSMTKRVCEKAGLPEQFRPMHGLRHTFASWLASSGQVTMYELQKLLTHSTPQMTQRYAHLHDEALRKASKVAADLFGAVQSDDGGEKGGEEGNDKSS